ncbi:MAG: NUDIX domain-containing protein [Hyphomicrobiales bacterium]
MDRDSLLRRIAPLLWRGQVLRWQLTGGHVMGAKVIVVREGRVLLIRQTYRSGWFLPGGGLKRGESPEAAARREAREEAGAELGELEFRGLFSHRWGRVVNHLAVFASREARVAERKHWEIAERGWFDPAALPRDTAPGDRRRIEEYCAGQPVRSGRW